MYEELTSFVEAYRNIDNPDYAIMISGGWGCGKTYYVEHELKDVVTKSGGHLLYATMFGAQDYEHVATQLMLSSFAASVGIRDDDLRSEYWLGKVLNTLGRYESLLTKGIHSAIMHLGRIRKNKATKIDKGRSLIVLDDVERALSDDIRTQILGCLYDEYIRRGYHVLMIGDEAKIKSESAYFESKEKYVRRTIEMGRINANVIVAFVETKCKQIEWLYESIKKDWALFASHMQIENLRAVDMLIGGLVLVVAKLGKEFSQKNIDLIFWSLIPLIHAVATGLLKAHHSLKDTGLDRLISVQYYYATEDKRTNLTEAMKIACVFYDRYCEPYKRQYVLIPALFDFAIKGFVDATKVKEEIDAMVSRKESPEGVAFSELSNYWIMEESDLLTCMNKTVAFLDETRYNFSEILTIYRYFYGIKKDTYVSDWPYPEDLTDMFLRFIRAREAKEPLSDRETRSSYRVHQRRDLGIEGMDKLYEEIDVFYSHAIADSNKERVARLMEVLKAGNRIVPDELSNSVDGEWRLLRDFEEYGKFGDIAELPVVGLDYIVSGVRSNILRISNSADFERHQIPAINHLATYLEGCIRNNDLTKSRKARLGDLVKVLRSAVKHMEDYDARQTASKF